MQVTPCGTAGVAGGQFEIVQQLVIICSNLHHVQRRRRLAEMTAGGRSNILDPARRETAMMECTRLERFDFAGTKLPNIKHK